MANLATTANSGFKCPYKRCVHSQNRFYSLGGMMQHLRFSHPGYLERLLKLKKHSRSDYKK